MMLQIGVGYAPRALRALQTQPAQGLMLAVVSDNEPVAVSATAVTIQVAAPSAHAGTFSLSLTDLMRGPVCLVAPAITETGGTLNVASGLWAYEVSLGAATVTRQWLTGGTAVKGATGLSFTPATAAVAQTVICAETVRQNGVETSCISAPFVLQAATLPQPEPEPEPQPQPAEPARLSVSGNATLELVADPAGSATVEVIEPAVYAGSYTIAAARLQEGPLWLVPARIQGTAQPGSQLSLVHRGLHVSDSGAGPVSLQGQWQRDGAAIEGAVADTYAVQASDAGCRIAFLETATDSHGARRQLSNEIAIGGTL